MVVRCNEYYTKSHGNSEWAKDHLSNQNNKQVYCDTWPFEFEKRGNSLHFRLQLLNATSITNDLYISLDISLGTLISHHTTPALCKFICDNQMNDLQHIFKYRLCQKKPIQWDFHPQEKIKAWSKIKFVFILKVIKFATEWNLFHSILWTRGWDITVWLKR